MSRREWAILIGIVVCWVGLLFGASLWRGGRERVVWTEDVSAINHGDKPTFVYFTATWCGPCQSLKTTTWADPAVAGALGRYTAVKVDVDAHPDWAAKFQIQAVPCFIVLNPDGSVKKRSEGVLSAEEFLTWLDG